MPVFEYQCKSCSAKYEVYHKSSHSEEDTSCPSCHSNESKKLFSSFSANVTAESSLNFGGGCASGHCDVPSGGGCASGMCGLN